MENREFEAKTYTQNYHFKLSYLHPRYFGLWLLVAILWVIGRLPLPAFFAVGRKLGHLLQKLGGSRVHITRENLKLCFPDMPEAEREALLRKNFESLGVALIEPGLAWFARRNRILKLGKLEIDPKIQSYFDQGKPVMLSALHMTCLEMACRTANEYMAFNLLYRPNDNPVFEYISGKLRQRSRYHTRFIPRKQVKDLLYFMQKGEPGMILPDQDFGPKRSIFLPFFGVPAATIVSTSDFARQTGAVVSLVSLHFDQSGYTIRFSAPLEGFPSDDPAADSLLLNQMTERRILEHPEQYIWQHRRFKTRPEGEPSIYPPRKRRKKK